MECVVMVSPCLCSEGTDQAGRRACVCLSLRLLELRCPCASHPCPRSGRASRQPRHTHAEAERSRSTLCTNQRTSYHVFGHYYRLGTGSVPSLLPVTTQLSIQEDPYRLADSHRLTSFAWHTPNSTNDSQLEAKTSLPAFTSSSSSPLSSEPSCRRR